ncbi:unnamed protein product [Dovyalis caffra]|uniref:Uncharacterized protein n=1 Tax=Dovyalis caffra TaxID=77055 RepID=A0AAV1S4F0_9ROSI|nr:unnamed protein product [Dovyalis caffra]
MSNSFEIFDKVKAEKADAMRRYNRKRNFYYFLEAVGALVLLWCSFSCFPVIKQAASHYLSFFNQKIYAFLVANIFILMVYLSSTTASNNDQNDTPIHTDIYDEYVSFSTSSSPRWKTTTDEDKRLVVSALQGKPVQGEEKNPVHEKNKTFDIEKQIVCCEKTNAAANDDEVGKNPVRDLTVLKQEKAFQRTRSERHGKEKRDYLREFRRSETEIGRETSALVSTSLNYNTPAAARKSMLEMNNDEFRLTIERFIATTKKILKEESIALLSEEK